MAATRRHAGSSHAEEDSMRSTTGTVQDAENTGQWQGATDEGSTALFQGGIYRDDDDDEDENTSHSYPATTAHRTSAQSFTPRSLVVGIAIGTLITFSNTYFGLQTGWISSMAMPSSLIGFAVFKSVSRFLSFPFSPIENVLIQTVAGAVGTMPLGCGFVGVVPALEFLLREGPDGPRGDEGGGGGGQGEGGPLKLTFWKLVVWSLGVCLFGVVFAVPLRKEVIIREKLKFPTGTATALMIRVLHGGAQTDENNQKVVGSDNAGEAGSREETERLLSRDDRVEDTAEWSGRGERDARNDWKVKIRLLIISFSVSAFYTLLSYFIPVLRDLPIFGLTLASKWLWTLNPSPAYVGQGIIMGPSTSLHMLVGAIIGWGILSPLAKSRGWAPGPVDDWEKGSKGWIVWVSLAIMLADSVINLGWVMVKPFINYGPSLVRQLQRRLGRRSFWEHFSWIPSRRHQGYTPIQQEEEEEEEEEEEDGTHLRQTGSYKRSGDNGEKEEEDDAPPSELISPRTVLILLPLTLVLNVICMRISFGGLITPLLACLATFLALVLSIMGVRAQGETDLNPVSGISKVTQLIFALATPASSHTRRSAVVTNLLAGAVSESGALQAGDMMQDLKTGHILGASPKAQFYGQLIGSLVGALISASVYRLYVRVYEVPGPMFQVPTAYVWIFTARLVTGEGLPEMAWPASGAAAILFAVATVLRIFGSSMGDVKGGRVHSAPWRAWIPGGIAVAVGIYNVPSFTLARAIGGVIALWWGWRQKRAEKRALGKGAVTTAAARSRPCPSDYHDGGDGGGTSSQSEQSGRGDDEDAAHQDAERSSSTIVVLASGLILGEGVVSIINLALASAGVPHL